MKLKNENDHDYEEGCGGKRTRYNTSNEKETMAHTPNKEQSMPEVQASSNYSRVLQAPAPTHLQEDVNMDGGEKQQFPSLPRPQPPRVLVTGVAVVPHGSIMKTNWINTWWRNGHPTVG